MKYSFSKEQIDFMSKMELPIDPTAEMSVDESIELFDAINDALLYDGFDDNYNPNAKGIMYESIEDVIIKEDHKAGYR